MEEQLSAYRAKKAREQQLQREQTSLLSGLSQVWRRSNKESRPTREKVNEEIQAESPRPSTVPDASSGNQNRYQNPHYERRHATVARSLISASPLLTSPTLWKFILWLVIWGFFIEFQFGSVFFVISLFYIIYSNMRSGPRQDGQLSAYSVFNPNFERLDGTFTAEQFEKELKYGPGSVH